MNKIDKICHRATIANLVVIYENLKPELLSLKELEHIFVTRESRAKQA